MRLTIGDTLVEVGRAEDIPIATTFEASDLLDPSRAKGARSNSMRFPQSISNSILGSRDMAAPLTDRTKVEFKIDNGAGFLWHGSAVPIEISRSFHEWLLLGDNAAWFDAVKDKNLRDLDLGESEVHSVSAVQDSWQPDSGLNHFFPLVDYGNLGDKAASYDVDLKYIFPSVKVRSIIERMFADIGYAVTYGGTLGAHIDNLYLLFTEQPQDLRAVQYILDENVMRASRITPITIIPATAQSFASFADIDFDPASQNGTAGSFIPVFTGNYTMVFSYTIAVTQSCRFFVDLVDVTNSTIYVGLTQSIFSNGSLQTFDQVCTLENIPMVAGNEYRLQIRTAVTSGNGLISVGAISWTPNMIPWQEGIPCYIAQTLPKMKQSEFIAGIFGAFDCAVTTDNGQRTINITPSMQWKKPVSDALDWTEKMDVEQSEQIKVRDDIPSVFEFRCAEDNNDRTLNAFEIEYQRGLGDHDHLATDENAIEIATVKVPWAATATGLVLQGIVVPRLLKEGQDDVNAVDYGWKPRLVYWEGMKSGDWVLQAAAQTEVPEVYFIKPGSEYSNLSLGFSSNGGEFGNDVGLVDRLHFERLASIEYARIVECDLYLNDEDIRTLDFARPVTLRIAGTVSAYYLLKVEEYLWGQHVSTPCRLISAVPQYPITKPKSVVPVSARNPTRR